MYEAYWGLKESPFRNRVDHRWFVPGATHDEALARLLFLVEDRRRFGLLVGNQGTGKSMLLDVLKQLLHRTPCQIVDIDLMGLSADEMLWNIASEINYSFTEKASREKLWRQIQDGLTGSRIAEVQTILLFDHLDQADDQCMSALRRLAHSDPIGSSWMTLLVAARTDGARRHAHTVSELADLQIEVTPFDHHATSLYIASLLNLAGCQREVFDDLAIDAIYDKTDGVPREINRLCDLSLLAAMGENKSFVDSEVVELAASELRAPTRPSQMPKSIHDPLPVQIG